MTETTDTEVWLDDEANSYVFVKEGGIGQGSLPPVYLSVGVSGANVRVYLTIEQAIAVSAGLDAVVGDWVKQMKEESVNA